MDYIQLNLHIDPPDPTVSEVIAAFLGEIGFESFEEVPTGLNACIQASSFNEELTRLVLKNIPVAADCAYTVSLIPSTNWNEEWEKSFEPVLVENKCMVRASFHPHRDDIPYTILIDPRMAFGTGHHETTWMMISGMLDVSFGGKNVLDMGTGTGVLAILASMLGAKDVLAVDIDDWSCRNAVENVNLNKATGIRVVQGDQNAIHKTNFHIILANINLNTLIAHIPLYSEWLVKDGFLLLSGYLSTDADAVKAVALQNGFEPEKGFSRNNWSASLFKKK